MSKLIIKKIDLNRPMRVDINAQIGDPKKDECKTKGDKDDELVKSNSTKSSASVSNVKELTNLVQQMTKELAQLKNQLVDVTGDLYSKTKSDRDKLLYLEQQVKQEASKITDLGVKVADSASLLKSEVISNKTALSSLDQHVAKVVTTLQTPFDATLKRVEKLEKHSLEQQNKLDQRFVDLTQYTLDAHLENAAASACLNSAINGDNEVVLRKHLYKEALKQGVTVAKTLELLPLAEAWDDLANKVDLTGNVLDAD